MEPVNEIRQFRGQYAFLSNYFTAPIVVQGIRYPTNEHAFAAFKTRDVAERARIAALPSPGAAKRAGRTLALRADWEEIKTQVMLALVRVKFSLHSQLAQQLLATGEATLVEGNTWNDRIWGVELRSGVGENRLGRILMAVRSELRRNTTATIETTCCMCHRPMRSDKHIAICAACDTALNTEIPGW